MAAWRLCFGPDNPISEILVGNRLLFWAVSGPGATGCLKNRVQHQLEDRIEFRRNSRNTPAVVPWLSSGATSRRVRP